MIRPKSSIASERRALAESCVLDRSSLDRNRVIGAFLGEPVCSGRDKENGVGAFVVVVPALELTLELSLHGDAGGLLLERGRANLTDLSI
ncbi:hypothetical protein [Legionella sp. CNM-4043-24]|uniref:hypothetical protein n=1 Tax=Legionella sp. CNM-4043-24 TaxID=3421646 RepID=UPI00403B2748